jgi:hypothetical protein
MLRKLRPSAEAAAASQALSQMANHVSQDVYATRGLPPAERGLPPRRTPRAACLHVPAERRGERAANFCSPPHSLPCAACLPAARRVRPASPPSEACLPAERGLPPRRTPRAACPPGERESSLVEIPLLHVCILCSFSADSDAWLRSHFQRSFDIAFIASCAYAILPASDPTRRLC